MQLVTYVSLHHQGNQPISINSNLIQMKNLDNIIELAALLVMEGKATIDNAFMMALEQDNQRCLTTIEDVTDMQNGYINEHNKTQQARKILLQSTYTRINNA